jgi:flavin reductase (DIM6/NTAB) family NADH-FMN oxidoreductase RutF
MPIDQNQLRKVMRQWSSGVCVVSTQFQEISHGMTVSSFTSVSLDPHLVAISLMKNSRTHDFVIDAGNFGITILSSAQKKISEIFAGQIPDYENRFEDLESWTMTTGAPLLKGGLAYLDCKLTTVYDYGTNSLVIGEVLDAKVGDGGMPLLYFNQRYHQLQE